MLNYFSPRYWTDSTFFKYKISHACWFISYLAVWFTNCFIMVIQYERFTTTEASSWHKRLKKPNSTAQNNNYHAFPFWRNYWKKKKEDLQCLNTHELNFEAAWITALKLKREYRCSLPITTGRLFIGLKSDYMLHRYWIFERNNDL